MTAHILVVDDEPDIEPLILQKFRSQIRQGVVAFSFVRDGVEALNALRSNNSIDLLITDINMPRMDGLSLLQRLLDSEENVSAIVVSAYSDMRNIRIAINRGAFDFITKPIDLDDLEATIAKTIGTSMCCGRRVSARPRRSRLTLRFHDISLQNLARQLATGLDPVDLGGQRREIAAIFTDIANFTELVETLEPSVLGPILNEYLTGMTEIVFSYEGTVAKIIGDSLYILFGAPGDQQDHATRAVACALEQDEYAQAFCKRLQMDGIALGVTRIGVHAGPAIVGNFGGGRFFDYTAYGDTINVAARLEAANKQLGTRICVSAPLMSRVESFQGRPVGDLVLRGKTEALRVFEPLPADRNGSAATKSYIEAFAKLENNDPGVTSAFAAHLGKYSDDVLATFHLKRLLNGATGASIRMD